MILKLRLFVCCLAGLSEVTKFYMAAIKIYIIIFASYPAWSWLYHLVYCRQMAKITSLFL